MGSWNLIITKKLHMTWHVVKTLNGRAGTPQNGWELNQKNTWRQLYHPAGARGELAIPLAMAWQYSGESFFCYPNPRQTLSSFLFRLSFPILWLFSHDFPLPEWETLLPLSFLFLSCFFLLFFLFFSPLYFLFLSSSSFLPFLLFSPFTILYLFSLSSLPSFFLSLSSSFFLLFLFPFSFLPFLVRKYRSS